jgi:site-specific recombinase XerD
MADPRQMPLFSSQPQTEKDINRTTQIQHTLPLFETYLQKEGKTTNTIKAFIADMGLLMKHAGEQNAVGDFQTKHLNAYLTWMEQGRGVPCSRKTYARRVTTLKVYFKWLKGIGVLTHDPAKAVLQRSGEAPLSYALNPDEIQRMLAFAMTMQHKKKSQDIDTRSELLFRLLLDTGIKKSEAKRLTVADIKRDEGSEPYLHVHHTARNVYKERKIPLDPDWLKLFDLYADQYKITDEIFTCTPRNLEYILEDIGTGAGIPTKVSFEIMRWTSAVRDARAGVEGDTIREKLGLSRISWSETGRKIERLVALQERAETGEA